MNKQIVSDLIETSDGNNRRVDFTETNINETNEQISNNNLDNTDESQINIEEQSPNEQSSPFEDIRIQTTSEGQATNEQITIEDIDAEFDSHSEDNLLKIYLAIIAMYLTEGMTQKGRGT